MFNLAKYASVAALAVGLGVAGTKPASAWGDTWWYNCGDGCGYGYGAFWPPFGFYPYGYDGYRPSYLPSYPHHFYDPAPARPRPPVPPVRTLGHWLRPSGS